MNNQYHDYKKKSNEDVDNMGPQTVFKATNSEISRTAVIQCKKHKWEKLNDCEIYCPVCQTGAIVGADNIEQYL